MMTIKITQIKNATAGNGRSSLSPLPSLSYLNIESSGPPPVITISLTNDRAGFAKGEACKECEYMHMYYT